MSFAKVSSAQTNLLSASIIDVEVDLAKGLYAFSIVGLADKAVDEARDRVSAAIKNSGFKSPKQKNQKIVISLAPADLRKEGPNLDLAIALAYLLASKDIRFDPSDKIFLGELSLDGKLRSIRGTLPLVMKAKELKFKEVYLPKQNAIEAALVDGIDIYGAENLSEVIEHIDQKRRTKIDAEGKEEEIQRKMIEKQKKTKIKPSKKTHNLDLSDIKGQESAKRGLEIAAAGGHNIAFFGPPGTGKTLLAKVFSGILPDLSFEEALEVTCIHSISGTLNGALVSQPPFRAPHHTSSHIAVVGGGAIPKPGEITLAHRGVLFMDEFPEFDKRVLEALRQPLEDRVISVSRSKGTAVFPASFILVAAMNPCPCGNFGSDKECVCLPSNFLRYQRKISGPIMDRVDIWIEVPKISHSKLSEKSSGPKESPKVKEKIERARKKQSERFDKLKIKKRLNAEMDVKDIANLIYLSEEVKNILNLSAERLGLSPRVYHKTIKLARTIADLDQSNEIGKNHLLEALQYRPKEINYI